MKQTRLQIDLDGSILLVMGATQEHLINELTIDKFSQYWRTVRQAVYLYTRQDDASFVDLWVEDDLFRQLVTRALELLGIENPASELTVGQMEAILFGIQWDGDDKLSPGAGSLLHTQNFPKPLAPGVVQEEPRPLSIEVSPQSVESTETKVEETSTNGKQSFWNNLIYSTRSTLSSSGLMSVLPISLPLLYLGLTQLTGTILYPVTS